MVLTLTRCRCNSNTIIGVLSIEIDGEFTYLAHTLENHNKAIPCGTYNLEYHTVSPRFGDEPFYKRVCDGKLPRLVGVPNRRGILIHCGNSFLDSSGCILVGSMNKDKDPYRLTASRLTFEKIYPTLRKCSILIVK